MFSDLEEHEEPKGHKTHHPDQEEGGIEIRPLSSYYRIIIIVADLIKCQVFPVKNIVSGGEEDNKQQYPTNRQPITKSFGNSLEKG